MTIKRIYKKLIAASPFFYGHLKAATLPVKTIANSIFIP
jgi:hypothetical protein